MDKNCINCNKLFKISETDINRGRGKFCSLKCYWKFSKVHPNKGTFKIGHPIGKRFTKGHKPWTTGIIDPFGGEQNHPYWKGDKVGYGALHEWVVKHLGKPNICEHCGKTEGKFQWANKSHKYFRRLDDWIRLCLSCHWHFDRD